MPQHDPHTETLLKISEIGAGVKAIHQRFDKHEADVTTTLQKHTEAIYGNGKPGLTTRVAQTESRLKFWGSIGTALLTAILLAFFGLK